MVLARCPAKLNLFLEVVRRRPDGYHDLDTVMQAIGLFDDLVITPHDSPSLSLECSEPSLPTDERNLVLRAATALRQHTGHRGGAHFVLTKRIPQQAGLGGGSSDAAGTLVGLNLAWGLGLARAELAEVAAAVGSDVPFFLHGGTARCTGRGESVQPIATPLALHYVVVCPPAGVPTADAYHRLRWPLTSPPRRASILVNSLARGRFAEVAGGVYNRLEEAAFGLQPELRKLKARLARIPLFAAVCMTGSGSAFFGLCSEHDWECGCQAVAALGVGRVFAARSLDVGATAAPAPA